MENINTRVPKEPRGLIRIIQIVFAILAFSTVVGFSTYTTLRVTCPRKNTESVNYKVNYAVQYPFKFEDVPISSRMNCSNTSYVLTMPMDFSSTPQFFVTTGVLSLLYSVGSLCFYVFMSPKYEMNPFFPMLDLAVTTILSIFWIAAAFAWIMGVSDIKYFTDPKTFKDKLADCNATTSNDCSTEHGGDWSSLNVSMIMGFGNAFIWCASIWFIFKETSLHPKRRAEMAEGPPNFDNYGPPGQQQMPQTNPFQPPQQQFSAY